MSRMNRLALLEILKQHISNEIVVSTYSTATDWSSLSERQLNYYSVGAMGLASSHGLGLALARPERKIIVLDGDGSLLMNLSTLVTIGKVAPRNFLHFVFKNESYEANGGHPIPNKDVDFEGLARSARYKQAETIKDLDSFAARLPLWMKQDGPSFVCLEIEQGPLGRRDYSDIYKAARRDALRQALASGA
jgi:thiamine pyrophosphate-dependent acetolactate synthase large subunit-like protein